MLTQASCRLLIAGVVVAGLFPIIGRVRGRDPHLISFVTFRGTDMWDLDGKHAFT